MSCNQVLMVLELNTNYRITWLQNCSIKRDEQDEQQDDKMHLPFYFCLFALSGKWKHFPL